MYHIMTRDINDSGYDLDLDNQSFHDIQMQEFCKYHCYRWNESILSVIHSG